MPFRFRLVNRECAAERDAQDFARRNNARGMPEPWCNARSPEGGYACCRRHGHPGVVHVVISGDLSRVFDKWNGDTGEQYD